MVLDTPRRQQASHRAGLRRLVLLNTPDPTKWVVAHLGNADKLALGASPYASVPHLLADARLAAIGELIRRSGMVVTDEVGFAALCEAVRVDNPELMRSVVRLAAEVLTAPRRSAGRAAGRGRDQCGGRRRPGRAAGQPGLSGVSRSRGVPASGPPASLPARSPGPGRCAADQSGPRRARAGHHPALRGRLRRGVRAWPRPGPCPSSSTRSGGCWRSCGSACSRSRSARRSRSRRSGSGPLSTGRGSS